MFNRQDIVYLSPDSSDDLDVIDSSKVYILGGIVDHATNKWLTLHRARLAGLVTARLPITRYMEFATPTPHDLDLPLNIVASMLLDIYNGRDWPYALHTHLPKRKGFQLKSGVKSGAQLQD